MKIILVFQNTRILVTCDYSRESSGATKHVQYPGHVRRCSRRPCTADVHARNGGTQSAAYLTRAGAARFATLQCLHRWHSPYQQRKEEKAFQFHLLRRRWALTDITRGYIGKIFEMYTLLYIIYFNYLL